MPQAYSEVQRGYSAPDGERYAAWAGPPDAARAVCLFGPLGSEAVNARRILHHALLALAAEGYGVLALDPRGTGESAGEFEDATVESLAVDAACAVQELADRFPAAERRLAAFRYAALPVLAAGLEDEVERLLLVDPCLDARQAIRLDLRLEIVRQMQRRGRVDRDRDELLAELAAGRPIVLDGQLLTPALYDGLVAIDGDAALRTWGERAAVWRSERGAGLFGAANGGIVLRSEPLEQALSDWLRA